MRWAVGVLGVALSVLPAVWVGGPIGGVLLSVGVVATAIAVGRGSAWAATLVGAAAIGQVASAGIPTLGALAVAALLALFLAVADAAETGARTAQSVRRSPEQRRRPR